jgi:short-subunit dehydrogenase
VSERHVSGRTALVTGGSGGIGLALARLLARDGHALVLVARGEERLRAEAAGLETDHGVPVAPLAMDLSRPGAARELHDAVSAAGLHVDVLVNNAGFGTHGPFARSELDEQIDMIRLNVEALTGLTRLALPGMLERGSGRILNVASTAAFQPGPDMAIYFASKAFVLSFTGALAEELRGSGVTATALCPGPVLTGFQERAGVGVGEIPLHSRIFLTDVERVAAAGIRGMRRGDPLVVPGLLNRLGAMLPRFIPWRWQAPIVSRLVARR